MIQLKLEPRPPQLTDQLVNELTALFKADSTQSVWKKDYIESALRDMSFGKCCYCECKINEESKYLEIEHFRCKAHYPDWVLVWDNLLPSCKRCNGTKRDHDVVKEPMVHPVYNDPRNELTLRAYRFYGKTEMGKTTVRVLDLNNYNRIQIKRFEVGAKIKDVLESLEEDAQELEALVAARKRKRIVIQFGNILRQGLPTEEYAATVATAILTEEAYRSLRSKIIDWGEWDDDFDDMERQLETIAFL